MQHIKSIKALRNMVFISVFILTGCATVHHATKLNSNFEVKKPELIQALSETKTKDKTTDKTHYRLMSEKGFEQFIYGSSQPVVSCSPFELTVITLEKGENVSSVSSGDPLRWSYSLVYSGEAQEKEAQIMLKPSEVNISTDLVITTDKRLYTLKLISTNNKKYLRSVKFWYPAEIEQVQIQETDQDLMGIHLAQLNFNYELNTSFLSTPRWKPLRVFDDGNHTFIQMPENVNSQDLPAVFEVNENSDEKSLVNYRYKKPYFIVDKIFKEAEMLLGVGHNQSTVTLINKEI